MHFLTFGGANDMNVSNLSSTGKGSSAYNGLLKLRNNRLQDYEGGLEYTNTFVNKKNNVDSKDDIKTINNYDQKCDSAYHDSQNNTKLTSKTTGDVGKHDSFIVKQPNYSNSIINTK